MDFTTRLTMFSDKDLEVRAGIRIVVNGEEYFYSLDFFMTSFIEYTNKEINKLDPIKLVDNSTAMCDLKEGSKKYFQLSQAIIPENNKLIVELSTPEERVKASEELVEARELLAQLGIETPFVSLEQAVSDANNINKYYCFMINKREINMPISMETNRYIYDFNLTKGRDNDKISYKDMCNYIKDYKEELIANYFQENNISDEELKKEYRSHYMLDYERQIAKDMLTYIFTGNTELKELKKLEVFSTIIATLFIAEPSKNPSCFIPTLMLLDLISNAQSAPYNQPYHFANCLTNQFLAYQDNINEAYFASAKFFSNKIEGLGKKGEKRLLSEQEKVDFNGMKKYGKTKKNVNRVITSDYLMRHGGYFPMSHSFSFSELEEKAKEGIMALSHKKSFIIISDWLRMRNIGAVSLNKDEVDARKITDHIDKNNDILSEKVFPKIWLEIDFYIKNNECFSFSNIEPRNTTSYSKKSIF